MIVFLRFVGIMNASLWFGASIFFTFGVAPTFFTPEFKAMLGGGSAGEYWAGRIAQVVLERYFVVSYVCGGIALAHLVAEWLYLGKTIQRVVLITLVGAFALGLAGGTWLQPKLQALHRVKYDQSGQVTTLQQAHAARSFNFWHGVSQVMNLCLLCGLGYYVWRISHHPDPPRFVTSGKFRS